MKRRNTDLQGRAPDRSATALLILDMFSDFRFPDGTRICRAAMGAARCIAPLKARATAARVPTIYVNDAPGRWRSDFGAVLRAAGREGSRGAAIARLLAPGPRDYCILKPRHSGFFATPLGALLESIGARTLVLTGVTSDQCVLFTANDAYVREYGLRIPRDCIGSAGAGATRLALRYFERVLGADLRPSRRVSFRRQR